MPPLFHTAPPTNRYYAWFEALHTRVDILLLGPQPEQVFGAVCERMRECLAAVEQMGNRFNPDSELSRAVAGATVRPMPLSANLYTLLHRCLQAHRDTGGLFDITVCSPHFEPGFMRYVELTSDRCLRLHRPGLVVDLSGVLKGYALEQLRRLLTGEGIANALVNLGNSSILSLGDNPSDIAPGHCLTTSGNATAGRRHIMNPLTGRYVEGQREVSVTTADGVEGEVQSIVAFIRQGGA